MKINDAWEAFAAQKRDEVIDWNRFKVAWRKYAAPSFGQLTAAHCEKVARRYNGSTARRDLMCIKSFLAWSMRKGYIAAVPMIELPPESKPRECWLTNEQIAKCMAELYRFPVWMQKATRLLFLTGQRLDAVLGLRWDAVDKKSRTIDFCKGMTQADRRKRRAVQPLTEDVAAVIGEFDGQGPYVIHPEGTYRRIRGEEFREEWKWVCSEAGVPYITPHGIRHTVGTNLIQQGVPMQEVSHFLGHSSIQTTERSYVKRSPEYMKNAAGVMGRLVGR